MTTVTLGVYAAHPWGDNYAYRDAFGYLLLALYLAWAISPYLYFYLSGGRAVPVRAVRIIRIAGTLLICLAGTAVVIDIVLIHTDAQGGLIFLFMPVYQWGAIGVLELIVAFWPKQ
ncbi:MAG: hypothetical protein R3224_09355 [Balneolaceae bacterium]|nr:hypothetical protein [Balneolaceae bacterium]